MIRTPSEPSLTHTKDYQDRSESLLISPFMTISPSRLSYDRSRDPTLNRSSREGFKVSVMMNAERHYFGRHAWIGAHGENGEMPWRLKGDWKI